MRLQKRISRHPNLPYLREASESGNLGRVGEVVVSEVQPFQRKQPFDTREGAKPVAAKVKSGYSRQRIAGQ
jgi:predicted DNA-binding WGR domain protein